MILCGNQIKEISNIEMLNKLEYVDLSGNSISKIQGLPYSVKHLDISDNKIKKIKRLPKKLVFLNISKN